MSKYYIHKNKCRKKGYTHIILVIFLTILLIVPLSELTFQKIQARTNDFFSDNIKIVKTYIDEKTSKSDMLSVVNGVRIDPNGSESPIRKYFTTQKIVWTFDDYWINSNYYPPHKGFGGLSEQIHSYGGFVGINCVFIDSWIGAMFGNEIRNYSVVQEFSPYTSGYSQAHIDKSLEFFNKSYIEAECHGWNHSEDLDHATLSFAYKIVNYTLWNWYNNYHIKPRFWLGPGSDGNYNISLALKKFSETYWTVYAEYFKIYNSTLFPNHIEPAVEYIGLFIDPTFGCEWGNPYTTVQEAQQLFTEYAQGKEILAVRGHLYFLNGTDQRATENLTKWQQWIDWIYQTHVLININHTEAIEYKIDRDHFIVEKNSPENFVIDLTDCTFDHNVLFTNPDGTSQRNWVLSDQSGNYIGIVREDVFFELNSGVKYFLNADVTPPVFGTPSPGNGSTGNLLSLTWNIPINDSEGNTFSWTIQCSNGQANSGTSASNGTKSLVLSGLTYLTTYKVWVNATDPTGSGYYTKKWYTFATQQHPNVPPDKPKTPTGPTSGDAGVSYVYSSNTTDSNGDQVYYLWDWGDGTDSGWIGTYDSGYVCQESHIWGTKGSYNIKVKAKDTAGAESVWSDPLPIAMPYSFNKPILHFLEWLCERFPNAFPLLRQIMGYSVSSIP